MKKRTKPVFAGAEVVSALVYLCSISVVMMYLLCREHIVICTIIMTALCCGLYMLFYIVRKRRLVSFLVFAATLAAAAGVCAAVGASMGQMALIKFIYDASDYFDTALAAASIVLFSFVVTYPVFYFTVRLPRSAFLLLPALAPLILAARTLGSLPGWVVAFLGAGYLVAVLGMARAEYPNEVRYVYDEKTKKERRIFIGIAGAVMAALLMIVPRSDITPNADLLDSSRFSKTPFYGGQNMTGFTQNATPNAGNNHPSENVLFYVTTKKPRNVVSQSFDIYKSKEGWTYLKNYMGTADWQNRQKLLNYNHLAARLKVAADEGKLSAYADELLKLSDVPAESLLGSMMSIQVNDSSNTTVVRHPIGTYNAWISGLDVTIYRTEKDELFTERPFGEKAAYALGFYGEPVPSDFARYMSRLSDSEYSYLLNAAFEEDVIDAETASAFLDEYYSALSYKQDTFDDAITPEIQELADEITAGLDNDYDKALAIERWFGKDNFVYDLNFVPQELSAEYFIFKSKRGICTDFATASVLLLRAAGIPARYTEGFLIKTDRAHIDLYGRYEVKADQAHAFATAYIPGSGWIEIDGTKYATEANDVKELQLLVFIIVCAAAVCAVLCVIFRKRLSEVFFAISYKFGKSTKKIRSLYIRTRAVACRISGADPKSATSGEVREIISQTLLLETEAAEITNAADALMYGGVEIKLDEKRLYRDYKKIIRVSRKRK